MIHRKVLKFLWGWLSSTKKRKRSFESTMLNFLISLYKRKIVLGLFDTYFANFHLFDFKLASSFASFYLFWKHLLTKHLQIKYHFKMSIFVRISIFYLAQNKVIVNNHLHLGIFLASLQSYIIFFFWIFIVKLSLFLHLFYLLSLNRMATNYRWSKVHF